MTTSQRLYTINRKIRQFDGAISSFQEQKRELEKERANIIAEEQQKQRNPNKYIVALMTTDGKKLIGELASAPNYGIAFALRDALSSKSELKRSVPCRMKDGKCVISSDYDNMYNKTILDIIDEFVDDGCDILNLIEDGEITINSTVQMVTNGEDTSFQYARQLNSGREFVVLRMI